MAVSRPTSGSATALTTAAVRPVVLPVLQPADIAWTYKKKQTWRDHRQGRSGEPCRRLSSVVLVLRHQRASPGLRKRCSPERCTPCSRGAAERTLKVLLRTLAVAPMNMAGAAQVLDFSASRADARKVPGKG